jgi:hypothetical protein
MNSSILALPLFIALSAAVFAGEIKTSEQSELTAKRISSMCEKMKPTIYTKNDVGTITRKGCRFKDHSYTIIYEVDGDKKYVTDMRESGILNQNAKNGDMEEMKRYCKSYAWLYRTGNLAKKIIVEYQDTSGKILASKYIDLKDCKQFLE